jgi:glycosyltransferase involved in cell wall biosynthesis
MRIAIVISQTPPITSGVARIAARMESGLRERGCGVDVFSASKLPRVFWGEYRFVNVLPLFHEILERQPYDVINIFGPVPTFSDVLLLLLTASRHRLRGVRIVYSHVWDVEISRMTAPLTWAYNSGTRQIARLADYVVVSSQSHYDDLVRFVPADRVRIVPWGIDDSFICPTMPRKVYPLGRDAEFTECGFCGTSFRSRAEERIRDLARDCAAVRESARGIWHRAVGGNGGRLCARGLRSARCEGHGR